MDNKLSFAPKALRASKAGVEGFAEEFAAKVGFNAGDDIEALVRRAGGELVVGSSGHGDDESGSIIARSTNDFTIYISRHTSAKRDRFTIAHELGHLLLHFGAIQKEHPDATMRATRHVDESNEDQQRAEWEANWFAAAFLMPSEKFIAAYEENPNLAANLFGVSQSAAEIRAKTLGLK